MKRYGLFLAILVVLAGVTVYVCAANSPIPNKPACVTACSDLCSTECSSGMGYGFGPKGLANVKPNAVQVKKLQKIHSDFVATTKVPRARIQQRMRELSSMWAYGKGKPATIKHLIDGIESDRRVLRNAAVDSTFKALSVLDSSQRDKLQASVVNGYVHLLTIGTRMSGGSNASMVKSKSVPVCGMPCKTSKK